MRRGGTMNGTKHQHSVLRALRALVPHHRLRFDEVLKLAETQADHLLKLSGLSGPPFQTEIITRLPRIKVWLEREAPVSASTHWNGQTWIIVVNGADDPLRRHYSLAHELKHIIDHPFRQRLYRGSARRTAHAQAEWAAEFFAACLLVPARWLRQIYAEGCRSVEALADHFQVSERAIENRLRQLGLPVRHAVVPMGGLV